MIREKSRKHIHYTLPPNLKRPYRITTFPLRNYPAPTTRRGLYALDSMQCGIPFLFS